MANYMRDEGLIYNVKQALQWNNNESSIIQAFLTDVACGRGSLYYLKFT